MSVGFAEAEEVGVGVCELEDDVFGKDGFLEGPESPKPRRGCDADEDFMEWGVYTRSQ